MLGLIHGQCSVETQKKPGARIKQSVTLNGTVYMMNTAIQTHIAMILKAPEIRSQLGSELRATKVSEVLWPAV